MGLAPAVASHDSSGGTKKQGLGVFGFVLIAYLFSWAVWISNYYVEGFIELDIGPFWFKAPRRLVIGTIGTFGPGIAALFAVGRESGTRRVRELFRSLVPRNLKWIAAAILAPTSLLIITYVCAGYSVGYFNAVSMEHWIRLFAISLPLTPLWEEVGWRGYLLPKLQSKFRGLSAAMVVGAIWGPWHLPLHVSVVTPRTEQVTFFMWFLISVLGWSIIFTWFYNKSLGNLGVLVALHASLNATATALLGPAMAEHGLWPFVFFTIAVWAACLIVLFVAGTDLSCPRQPAR